MKKEIHCDSGWDWDPNKDQTYGLMYGTRTVCQPADQFSKSFGTSFTMNAYGETLTLMSLSEGLIVWGQGSLDASSRATQINILNGTLRIEREFGSSAALHFASDGKTLTPVRLSLANNGALYLSLDEVNVPDGDVESTAKIFLEDQAIFATECLSSSVALNAQIYGQSQMIVRADQLIRILPTTTAIVSSEPDGQKPGLSLVSLHLVPPGDLGDGTDGKYASIHVENKVEIIGTQKSTLEIAGSAIVMEDGASFLARENAQFNVRSDQVAPRGPGAFNLGPGSANFIFTFFQEGVAQGAEIFDVVNKKYPKGTFNFITNQGENKGKFIIAGKFIASAFGFSAMVQNNLIAINGVPANNDRFFNSSYDGGKLSIWLNMDRL